jgi:hypothetical protein
MKKFKLIKEYPHSPKIGTVIHRRTTGEKYWSYDNNAVVLFEKDSPENYPEFWKELEELCVPVGSYLKISTGTYKILSKTDERVVFIDVENPQRSLDCLIKAVNKYFESGDWVVCEKPEPKDYEIFSLICNKNTGVLFYGDIVHLKENFYEGVSKDGISIKFKKSEISNLGKHWSIHSVKRLSDGEIFTIGDKVNWGNNFSTFNFEIEKFYIPEDNILKIYIGGGVNAILKSIQLKKKPLFTTEDGVDIFKSDVFYFVRNNEYDNWTIDNMYGQDKDTCKTHKRFSTEKKAEEYILMNKPCLSVQDIFNKMKEKRKDESFNNSRLATILVDLAKEKQQQ